MTTAAAFVAGNDAPRIGERAAARGRVATDGGDEHAGVKNALTVGEGDTAGQKAEMWLVPAEPRITPAAGWSRLAWTRRRRCTVPSTRDAMSSRNERMGNSMNKTCSSTQKSARLLALALLANLLLYSPARAADTAGTNCPAAFRPYSTAGTPLLDLLINPATKELVDRDLPGFLAGLPPMLAKPSPPTLADILTIRTLASEFAPLPATALDKLDKDLALVPLTQETAIARCALIKDTRFELGRSGKSVNLQFRAELFNLLNIVNFGLPSNIITGSGFGIINRTAGNSRQVQFSLKAMF